MPIRVLLVDDVGDLRLLYRLALDDGRGIEVVGEAEDGAEAVVLAERLLPDVILLDLAMPRLDGLAALPRLRAVAPQARVLILSGFGGNTLVKEALSRCAYDYLEKGMSFERIVTRIHEVHQGPPKVGCR